MPESVPVRCPACRREHVYTAPPYPCPCGAPVVPPLDHRAAPTAVAHRAWDEEWIGVRCASCGRRAQWPRPELGCPCGTVLRIAVAGTDPVARTGGTDGRTPSAATTRGARDAVTAVVLYLRRLGHEDVPPSGRIDAAELPCA